MIMAGPRAATRASEELGRLGRGQGLRRAYPAGPDVPGTRLGDHDTDQDIVLAQIGVFDHPGQTVLAVQGILEVDPVVDRAGRSDETPVDMGALPGVDDMGRGRRNLGFRHLPGLAMRVLSVLLDLAVKPDRLGKRRVGRGQQADRQNGEGGPGQS